MIKLAFLFGGFGMEEPFQSKEGNGIQSTFLMPQCIYTMNIRSFMRPREVVLMKN